MTEKQELIYLIAVTKYSNCKKRQVVCDLYLLDARRRSSKIPIAMSTLQALTEQIKQLKLAEGYEVVKYDFPREVQEEPTVICELTSDTRPDLVYWAKRLF